MTMRPFNHAKPKLILGVMVLVGGCATTLPAPTQQLEASASSIRAAEELGASKVPQASLYLQLAKDESEHAKKLVANDEPERATGLLLRSQADADLAVALVREQTERAKVQETQERARDTTTKETTP